MKLCDTCIYRNNVEQLKPCIIYRDDCEYYEREEDMKAIIQIDVPNYQIGQEVSIYFKDTMMIKGIVQEPKTGLGDILIADQCECENCIHEEMCRWKEERHGQECAYMQKPKTGHCKDCKHFEYDSVAKVDGIPLIIAHEICNRWGDGCKTREDGYCFLFEPQEGSDKE